MASCHRGSSETRAQAVVRPKVSVAYETVDGSAKAGTKYVSSSGEVPSNADGALSFRRETNTVEPRIQDKPLPKGTLVSSPMCVAL